MANLNNRVSTSSISNISRTVVSEQKVRNTYTQALSNYPTFIKFESLPILDEVSNRSNTVVGSENPSFSEGVSGNGLKMRPRSGVDIGISLRSKTKFSLSFWLKPSWLRPVLSLDSNDINYYRLSLLNYSNISLNEVTNIYEASTGFCVFEESIESEQNLLYVFMDSLEGSILIKTKNPYKTSDFHHMYIAYSGAARVLNIYIDGKPVETEFVEGSQVPLFFSKDNNTPISLQLNQSAPGFSGLVRNNSGIIDELYFSNEYEGDSETVARHINFGSEFVAFNSLKNKDQSTCMFGFDDPSSIVLKSIFSNGNNVYAGRSDGRVYKGDRLLWQSRRDFSNREEMGFVKKSLLSETAEISISDGSLVINQGSVRL